MQALRERLIPLGVADKTGVGLERLPDQRLAIGNHFIWHASTAEEGLRDVALRVIQRVDADG